jgi:hypothetical protein
MNKDEYQRQEEMIRNEWFKNHAVLNLNVVESSPKLEVLTWGNPASSSYWVRYMTCGNVLTVYGDLGEAVYGWGQVVDFRWIAGLDLGYFHCKCCASECGRSFDGWDHRKALARLEEWFEQDRKARRKFNLEGGGGEIHSKQSWDFWLAQNGYEVFGDPSELSEIGKVIHIRCQAHLIGIKMAMEKIDATKTQRDNQGTSVQETSAGTAAPQ